MLIRLSLPLGYNLLSIHISFETMDYAQCIYMYVCVYRMYRFDSHIIFDIYVCMYRYESQSRYTTRYNARLVCEDYCCSGFQLISGGQVQCRRK